MSKVVITLTTIPSRVSDENPQGIRLCLESLVNQTNDEYEIHFNIPKIHKKTGEPYEVQDWIYELAKEHPHLKLFEDVEDLGPLTKLVHTIRRLKDPDDIIIVADDDLVYDPRMVDEQLKNQKKFPGAAVGYDGMDTREQLHQDIRDHFVSTQSYHCRVNMLQHYKTVIYKRSYFEDDFDEFIEKNWTWNDDTLISAYMAYKKRDRISTYHPEGPFAKDEDHWRLIGGVTSFPVLRHTHHPGEEGCWLFREDPDMHDYQHLYDLYISPGYFEDRFPQVKFVIYTNDRYFPFAEISVTELLKHAHRNINFEIVTNELPPEYELKYPDNTFVAGVPNKGGDQFGEVMRTYLAQLDNEIIFFMCDDYVCIEQFSMEDINRIAQVMKEENVDCFTFDRKPNGMIDEWTVFESKYYDNGFLREVPTSYLHRYSVQPALWKKEFFEELVTKK